MKRVWQISPKVLIGLFAAAMYATPQATVTARPGAINYIEGQAFLNGQQISQANIGKLEMAAEQHLTTQQGKVEVLLTPGVFLRLGERSEIRMVSPTLTHTVVEVVRGEAIVEAAQLYKENDIRILDAGLSATIDKAGLYRFTSVPSAAVFDGKATVFLNDHKVEVKKGREAVLAAGALKENKFDAKQTDDLYAWSDLRSEYNSSATYAVASHINTYGYGYGYGLGPGFGAGWAWDPYFSSFAWVPGDGFFYSPFGWGFYSPAYAYYAPIVRINGRSLPAPQRSTTGAAASYAARVPRVAASSRVSAGRVASVPVGRGFSGGGFSGGGFSGGGHRGR